MVSEIYNTDCMEYMKSMPDKFFDLAVVDPPYFSGPEKRGFYGKAVNSNGVHRTYKKSDEWLVPKPEFFDELKRVSKRYIVWGCNYYDYVFEHGRIVWDKCNGASSFSDCEIAATNLFDSVRMFRFMWNGMMQGKSISEAISCRETNRRMSSGFTRLRSLSPFTLGYSRISLGGGRRYSTLTSAPDRAA